MPTVEQFIAFLLIAVREKWGYVWSLQGQVYSEKMAQQFIKEKRSVPSGNTLKGYWIDRCKKWYGKRCADCSGLITWALLEAGVKTKRLNSKGFIDVCKLRGKVKDGIPNIDGLVLWKQGHIAVYYKEQVIEAKGTDIGVVVGKSSPQSFTEWGILPFLQYKNLHLLDTINNHEKVEVKTVNNAKTMGNLNLRSAPNTNSAIVKTLQRNYPVVACKPNNGWSFAVTIINNQSYKGYLSTKYLKFLD